MNLYELVFRAIFRLPECASEIEFGFWSILNPFIEAPACITGNPPQDFFYAFFLPHIILFMFMLAFMSAYGGQHKGLKTLLGVGVYVLIIHQGWYAFMTRIIGLWLGLAIIFAIWNFIKRPLIGSAEGRSKLGKKIGTKIKDSWSKSKKLRYIDDQMRELQKRKRKVTSSREKQAIEEKLVELEDEKRKIKSS